MTSPGIDMSGQCQAVPDRRQRLAGGTYRRFSSAPQDGGSPAQPCCCSTVEIAELLVRDTLYIQEDLSIASRDLRYRLNVDLAGPDGERLYFKHEVRSAARSRSEERRCRESV